MSFHCNARFISKLILDRRIGDGEFIRERFADFAALICFANCRDCRYDDYGHRQHRHASKQLHHAVRLWRTSAPERDHASIESKRHRRRNVFVRLRRRSQQPIDLFVLHRFSFSEIFASCCFIFCRARNARTLTSAALQPVILRISSTLRPCKYNRSPAARLALAQPEDAPPGHAKRTAGPGPNSSLELARFSITACSSTLKSACRTSGEFFPIRFG